MNNLTIDNDSITPQRTQPALHLYIFFSVVIPGFRSIGYSFISGTSVFCDFCPRKASYHFFQKPILPHYSSYYLYWQRMFVHVFPRHLGLRRTRAAAILALTPWEPLAESKNLTKVASFLRPNSIQFWMG